MRVFRVVLLAVGASVFASYVVQQASSSLVNAQAPVVLTRGPYLGNQTATSVQVIWNTNLSAETRVDYAEYGGRPGSGAGSATGTPGTKHVVTLTNLLTGTSYAYQIHNGGGAPLTASTLRTNRDDADPNFTFAALGDSGVGFPAQYNVAALLQRIEPAFVIHTGDVIYPCSDYPYFDANFFLPYSRTLALAPFFTSLGNHDVQCYANGAPYLDNFYLPSSTPANSERYYSFDYGNAHFVALDSNLSTAPSGPMGQWLAKDLASTAKFWKFVYFHHPPYSSGPHGSLEHCCDALRANLAPVFERNNVDIVFNGHDHDYERTVSMHDYITGTRGVVYIVTGGGGASVYAVGKNPWTAAAQSVHHAVKVTIAGCRLTLEAIQPAGEPGIATDATFDSAVLDRCPRVFLPTMLSGASEGIDTAATRRTRLAR